MRIAITSASGQLGHATIKALDALKGDHTVIGLARTPAKAADLGIEVRPGDYDAPDQLQASLAGVDTVMLISGNQDPAARVNQHRNVIAAAKGAGLRKIVFTSVQGTDGASEGPVGASYIQSEADIRNSGLAYVIGRNGVYIEPDVEYVDTYAKAGAIVNSAGEGRCGYTTRPELGFAYAKLLTEDICNGQTLNLHGTPLTQSELARHLAAAFDIGLEYRALSAEDYLQDRTAELGPMLGPIIAGIYDNIRNGGLDNPSDFLAAAGRMHLPWGEYFASLSNDRAR